MRKMLAWVYRRGLTISLMLFFTLWYIFQLVVLRYFGEGVAQMWFYIMKPPEAVSPGLIFGPISHNLDNLSHVGSNTAFLLVSGGLAEPYIDKNKILLAVFGLGYVGTYLTNITAGIHGFWALAGASTGIFALWSYVALKIRYKSLFYDPGIHLSLDGIEKITATVLFIGTPFILFWEAFVGAQIHTAHVCGILLGFGMFVWEYLSNKYD